MTSIAISYQISGETIYASENAYSPCDIIIQLYFLIHITKTIVRKALCCSSLVEEIKLFFHLQITGKNSLTISYCYHYTLFTNKSKIAQNKKQKLTSTYIDICIPKILQILKCCSSVISSSINLLFPNVVFFYIRLFFLRTTCVLGQLLPSQGHEWFLQKIDSY